VIITRNDYITGSEVIAGSDLIAGNDVNSSDDVCFGDNSDVFLELTTILWNFFMTVWTFLELSRGF
jgi:hypothetical protein